MIDALEADAPFDIGEAGLRDLPQHFRAEALALARPIDIRVLMRDRREDVERAHARAARASDR